MRFQLFVWVALISVSVGIGSAQSALFNFDNDAVDNPPAGFTSYATGRGPAGTWPTLRVVAKGDHITCYFNGKALIDAHDKTYTTGKIGLWTKADSVIAFDDLQVASQ